MLFSALDSINVIKSRSPPVKTPEMQLAREQWIFVVTNYFRNRSLKEVQ